MTRPRKEFLRNCNLRCVQVGRPTAGCFSSPALSKPRQQTCLGVGTKRAAAGQRKLSSRYATWSRRATPQGVRHEARKGRVWAGYARLLVRRILRGPGPPRLFAYPGHSLSDPPPSMVLNQGAERSCRRSLAWPRLGSQQLRKRRCNVPALADCHFDIHFAEAIHAHK